ncbi:5-hydroxytryptamine receptor 2A-like [Actinia tenebrosa]|uniref:5-hydroxytryptamine receptor 2A-like n=1 Tax=Actinia tenebrosa TaxID=6105 RepID=A0A6P8HBH7_ACTTE|nr:5-hydroxytryptamine receptor 2A-like [Actinia tenebrosa]
MEFNNTTIETNNTAFDNWTSFPPNVHGRRHPAGALLNLKELLTLLPLSILVALTNGLVFVLFIKRKKLRTPANYLLVSLAVADFITGTVNIPLFIAYLSTLDHQILLIFDPFNKLTAILTAYHILAVTAEKYIAIVKPLRHHSANPKMPFIVLGIVWLISSVVAVIPSFWMTMMRKTHRKTTVHLQLGHDVFCFVFVFLLPYIFMVYAQVVMFKAISKSKSKNSLQRAVTSNARQRKARGITNERKCLAIFACMAVLFAICWLPWFLLTFLATLTAVVKQLLPIIAKPETMSLLKTFAIVRFSTSIINPILYTFFKRDFMNACKSFCHCGSSRPRSSRMLSFESSIPMTRSTRRRLAKSRNSHNLQDANEQQVNISTTEDIVMQVITSL